MEQNKKIREQKVEDKKRKITEITMSKINKRKK